MSSGRPASTAHVYRVGDRVKAREDYSVRGIVRGVVDRETLIVQVDGRRDCDVIGTRAVVPLAYDPADGLW